ncbi:LysR family transcriptional regulator [Neorhizobium sp. S3-V5DH]|uniref:LysR family transcriptional regulator n=1 Tax=Neorhizobium sp. S3-V5DH TaxID=2485166 RepID=UPI0010DCB470|nr:LysR family transcriptional regulator [Neorhizobium sp. S3-V5DH]TCV68660.1 DNA-binding transcriptional LysR family regulator [Neorhizobium sp. S3-V5DH]
MDKILQQFLAIAECGSFSRAAQLLNVTQPTLTFNIKKLEEGLGVTLFKRTPRGVALTPYGMTLFENARIMRKLYDNTIGRIDRQRIQAEHAISIGVGYTWWLLFLRDWAFERRQTYPDAPIHISVGNQLRCMDQLLAGEISMFLGHETTGMAAEFNTRFVPFGYARQGYFVRRGHPLSDKPQGFEDIHAYPFVVIGSPEQRYERLFLRDPDMLSSPHLKMETSFSSNSMSACVDYVLKSDGILRFTSVLAKELAEKGLQQITLRADLEERPARVGIYATNSTEHSPLLAPLIEEIRALGASKLAQIELH